MNRQSIQSRVVYRTGPMIAISNLAKDRGLLNRVDTEVKLDTCISPTRHRESKNIGKLAMGGRIGLLGEKGRENAFGQRI